MESVFLSFSSLSHWHRGAAGAKNFGFSGSNLLSEGLFGTKVFRRKNEGNENGGKEDEKTVWNEGNERNLSSRSL
jgi:hypothetical protein